GVAQGHVVELEPPRELAEAGHAAFEPALLPAYGAERAAHLSLAGLELAEHPVEHAGQRLVGVVATAALRERDRPGVGREVILEIEAKVLVGHGWPPLGVVRRQAANRGPQVFRARAHRPSRIAAAWGARAGRT